MTHTQLRLSALAALVAAAVALSGCTPPPPPQTPAQALVEGYAALGSAVSGFNAYASQRPFCGDAGAKAPPFCADRAIVIEGDKRAHQVADALDLAGAAINATATRDVQWKTLAQPLTLLTAFQSYVAGVGK